MQQGKSILKRGLALLALLMFIAAGCGSDVNITEDEVIKRAKEEMALFRPILNMTAGAVKADLGARAVIYKDVTIAFSELSEVTFTVDLITVKGMDIPSYEGNPGDITEIDSITYKDLKVFLEGQQVGALDSYVLEGVRLPYRDMMQTLRDNQALSAEQLTLKLMPYMIGYEAKLARAKGFTFNYMFVQAAIDSMEARDIKLGSYGQSSLNKMQVSAMGRKVFSLDKIGYESMTFPQLLMDLMADPENYLDNNPEALAQLQTDPLAALSPLEVKGFYLNNLLVDGGAPFTLKELRGDFRLTDGALTLRSGMQELSLTRELLAQSYELRPLAQALTQDLLLSGDFNLSMVPAGSRMFDMAMQAGLKESVLGGFNLDIAGIAPLDALDNEYYYDENGDLVRRQTEPALFRHMEVSIDDNGIVDAFMSMLAAYAGGDPDGVDELYREAFASLDAAEAEAKHDAAREAVAGVRKLLRDGGRLVISFRPDQPVEMDKLEGLMLSDPDSLGYKLNYTPPAAPKQKL